MHWKSLSETKLRQAVFSNLTSPQSSPKLPVKVNRVRSNSTSMAAPPQASPPVRKRTSSGIFQVDDSEPLPKKAELTRSLSDSPRKKSEVTENGCQKTIVKDKSDKRDQVKEKAKEQKKKLVDKFDSEAKSNCVNAFKESDNWD